MAPGSRLGALERNSLANGLGSVDFNATKKCVVFKKLRCAQHYTAQWIVSNAHRERGFVADPLIEILE